MRGKNFFCALAIGFALLNFGCDAANSLTSTKIKDLVDHPQDYENKEITIYGTVTSATSLLRGQVFRNPRQFRDD